MKKLFYRLSSSRSYGRLLLILVLVALPALFPRQARAQIFGWDTSCEPDCVADGLLDARLFCGAVEGITTLTRKTPSTPASVQEAGQVLCTFDNGTTPPESAICTLNIGFPNLQENCDLATNTLTVTGTCPTKQGNNIVGSDGGGTINCKGGGVNGADPQFCLFGGNTSGTCTWNFGFAQKNGPNFATLTQNQCLTAFPADSDLQLAAGEIFKVTAAYKGDSCAVPFEGLGKVQQRLCQSDSFDKSKPAFCDFTAVSVKNTVEGQQVNHLTVDTEYGPTVNDTCNPDNSGTVNLTVFAVNQDKQHPNNNPVALEAIDQKTITVNGNSVIFKSDGTPFCSFDQFPNPSVMACNIKKCDNGHNIVQDTITGTGNKRTATLTFAAQMIDGTSVVGYVETVNVSSK